MSLCVRLFLSLQCNKERNIIHILTKKRRLYQPYDKAAVFCKVNRYLFLNRNIHILLRDTLAIKEFSILVGADIDVAKIDALDWHFW